MVSDPAYHVGQPGLWIDIVHLGRDDQAVHYRGALPTTIRTAEQPRLAPEGHPWVILPMLGMRSSSSITGGTRYMGASCAATTASVGPRVMLSMLKWRRVS